MLQFHLNGQLVQTEADPQTTVLQFVRSLGLNGTKEGCAEGDCGACTVLVLEADGSERSRYRALNACLLLLGAVSGGEVWTVEGLSQAEHLHPVQEAMVEHGGSQCGYCTPGFVMSMAAEYYRRERGSSFDEASLSGNLCRCTGYRPIRDAGLALGVPDRSDPLLERMERPFSTRSPLITPSVRRPTSIEEALQILANHPEAQLMAGGTDLGLEITVRGTRFPMLVLLDDIEELHRFECTDKSITIGAAAPLSVLEERLAGRLPLFDALWPQFASRQIRNRATLGGNLATASPIGDASLVLLALEAELEIAGPAGTRHLPIDTFFLDYRRSALEKGELISAVRIPTHSARSSFARFYKVAKRGSDDISIVAAAFSLEFENERISKARLAFGGVAATPRRAIEAEKSLVSKTWDRSAVEAARSQLASSITPISDLRASARYRSLVAGNLLEKFWHETGHGTQSELQGVNE